MRLICPNCGAQYEVPAEVIPNDGRDVQCSNCGNTWFQPHPDYDTELAEDLERAVPESEWEPEEATAPEPAPRRELDAAVAEVLRQERTREEQIRAGEVKPVDEPEPEPETAPEPDSETPGESDADRRERESRERMSRLRGQKPAAEPDPAPAAEPAEPAPRETVTPVAVTTEGSRRRNLLPDIEEIDSELDSQGDRIANQKAKPAPPPRDVKRRRRSGFRLGFGLTLLIAAGAISTYAYAPQIKQQFPDQAQYVADYVAWVDQGRVWLDENMTVAMLWLDEKAASKGGNADGFGATPPPQGDG